MPLELALREIWTLPISLHIATTALRRRRFGAGSWRCWVPDLQVLTDTSVEPTSVFSVEKAQKSPFKLRRCLGIHHGLAQDLPHRIHRQPGL